MNEPLSFNSVIHSQTDFPWSRACAVRKTPVIAARDSFHKTCDEFCLRCNEDNSLEMRERKMTLALSLKNTRDVPAAWRCRCQLLCQSEVRVAPPSLSQPRLRIADKPRFIDFRSLSRWELSLLLPTIRNESKGTVQGSRGDFFIVFYVVHFVAHEASLTALPLTYLLWGKSGFLEEMERTLAS